MVGIGTSGVSVLLFIAWLANLSLETDGAKSNSMPTRGTTEPNSTGSVGFPILPTGFYPGWNPARNGLFETLRAYLSLTSRPYVRELETC